MIVYPHPICAYCGEKMGSKDDGVYIARWLWHEGAPTVAWCGPCHAKDLLADMAHIEHFGIDRWLSLIAERGPGRVQRLTVVAA